MPTRSPNNNPAAAKLFHKQVVSKEREKKGRSTKYQSVQEIISVCFLTFVVWIVCEWMIFFYFSSSLESLGQLQMCACLLFHSNSLGWTNQHNEEPCELDLSHFLFSTSLQWSTWSIVLEWITVNWRESFCNQKTKQKKTKQEWIRSPLSFPFSFFF